MTPDLIDSHAHLTSSLVYDHIEDILQRAKEARIAAVVNICTDANTLEKGLTLAKRYSWVYNAAATTPHDVEKEGEALFPLMAHHARHGDLVAVGETGLDYHYQHSPPSTQKHFLKKYLHLALECQLPVVIHCRDAFAEFFEILDVEYMVNGKHAPGVLHCFTGNTREAEQVLERGWYLSLSGIVTFKKSEELREVAKNTPLHQLLIETDTPYLAPKSHRGKMNEPSYLVETAEVIALAQDLPLEEIARASANNARRLFNIHNSPHGRIVNAL
ncbi:MAG: TatD family hydrolase [Waddliaceae bacterium]